MKGFTACRVSGLPGVVACCAGLLAGRGWLRIFGEGVRLFVCGGLVYK